MDLVEGPLLNPKRLDEAIRATKFVRRLFSFFHPYNNRFSTVKRTRVSGFTRLKGEALMEKDSQITNGLNSVALYYQPC